MRYKWKDVMDTVCSCCKVMEVKELTINELQCHLLQSMCIFLKMVDYLQQQMNGQKTEPDGTNMGAILCLYIKGKGRENCQAAPHLPMEISYTKLTDDIGWYHII